MRMRNLYLAAILALTGTGCGDKVESGRLSDGSAYRIEQEEVGDPYIGTHRVRNIIYFDDCHVVDESKGGKGDLSQWVRDDHGRIVTTQRLDILDGEKAIDVLYHYDSELLSNALRRVREVYALQKR